MAGFSWGQLIQEVAPSLIGLGTGLIVNNQNVQNAQGQANASQEALNTQYQIALQNQENIKLMQQAGQTPVVQQKNNTLLYVGLGVGGVLILGLTIFAVTRK